jgi:7-cyano-7-deazaguanine synthase
MTYRFVAVLSGGLDSTTMMMKGLEDLHAAVTDVLAVSFNYGQRHYRELAYAESFCQNLGIDHIIIDLRSLGWYLGEASGSSLVNPDVPVPEGHYAEESMKATVVPNRNMVMYSIAASIAVASKAIAIGVGVHTGDHAIYPDCRPDFINKLEQILHVANEGFIDPDFAIYSPFENKDKNWIASEAVRIEQLTGIPIVEATWSCYKGDRIHCGKCGTCVERQEALNSVIGYQDPTHYEDPEYWKEAIANG